MDELLSALGTKPTPLVSIIMPVYNAEKWVEQAIESMLAQSLTNWELLVADDGSQDSSRERIDAYTDPRILRIHNTTNLGYLATCNKLMSLSSGAYIAFQDADDYSDPQRLKRQLALFEGSKNLGACGCFSRYFADKSKKTLRLREGPVDDTLIRHTCTSATPFDGATLMVSRLAYEEVGPYRTFFDRIGAEHVDWLLRIMDRFEVAAVPEVLYHVRLRSDSFSRRIVNQKQLISADTARFFHRQRAENGGADALTPGADHLRNALNDFMKEALAPYTKDPSLQWRVSAANNVYASLYKSALTDAWQAFTVAPLKVINLRTLFYCVRKWVGHGFPSD